MRVRLKLFRDGEFTLKEFEIETEEKPTVLDLLQRVKEIDPTVSFRAMCRASVCGTCAVKVNGKPVLACNTRVWGEEVLIEPLDNSPPIKDLVVSHEELFESMRANKVWILPKEENLRLSPVQLAKTSRAWDCILCNVCNTVCPPLVEGKNFGGPALITKVFSVVEDPRDGLGEGRDLLGLNLQSCVHCGNCNLLCPKGCMPERWVTFLEGKLAQKGYIQKGREEFGFLNY